MIQTKSLIYSARGKWKHGVEKYTVNKTTLELKGLWFVPGWL